MREQLEFVSPDGKRVLVLAPLLASLRAGTRWQDVEVATLHEHGVRVKGTKAGALLHAPLEVREPALRILWVKGLGGFPGAPPQVHAHVELGVGKHGHPPLTGRCRKTTRVRESTWGTRAQ